MTPKGWVFGTPAWVFLAKPWVFFLKIAPFLTFLWKDWECLMINLEILVMKMSKNTFTLVKEGPWKLIFLYFFRQNFKLTPIPCVFCSKLGLSFFPARPWVFWKHPKKSLTYPTLHRTHWAFKSSQIGCWCGFDKQLMLILEAFCHGKVNLIKTKNLYVNV